MSDDLEARAQKVIETWTETHDWEDVGSEDYLAMVAVVASFGREERRRVLDDITRQTRSVGYESVLELADAYTTLFNKWRALKDRRAAKP